MRVTPNANWQHAYSSGFLALVMIFLLSFAAVPGFSPSSISTDFRWRKQLVGLFNSFRLKVGDKVFYNGIIGRNGWMFLATQETSLNGYQKSMTWDKARIAALRKGLDQLSADLEKEGRTLLVVAIPDKSTVYSQYMPEEIPVIGEISPLDQLAKAVMASGKTRFIDLRPALKDASASRDVYYKADSHWNDLGAYYAYVEIMKALSRDYPGLAAHPLSDFKQKYRTGVTRDLPRSWGVSYPEDYLTLVPDFPTDTKGLHWTLDGHPRAFELLTNENKSLPSLLMYGDSFSTTLNKFLNPHFSRFAWIPLGVPEDAGSLRWIDVMDPDIVIIIFVERGIEYVPGLLETGK